MAQITLKGNPVNTLGELPEPGTPMIGYELVAGDLSIKTNKDFQGNRCVYNIFPSLDTGTCAQSVRTFNEKAASLENTVVLCVSRDLPFAMSRFCAAEGIERVHTLSDFRQGTFGKALNLEFADGPLLGLHSRVVIVTDSDGKIVYTEQVQEIVDEPNYEAALNALGHAG